MQHIILPEDTKIALVGDSHQNTKWMKDVIKSVQSDFPDAVIIQLGDFGLGVGHAGASYLRKVNKALKGKDMFVVLGNHDNYDKLQKAVPHPLYPGGVVLREAQNIVFLNRGARIRVGDKTIVGVSGANSINREFLATSNYSVQGMTFLKSYWEQEQISDSDVHFASYPGHADVLLSHDCPMTGFPMDKKQLEDAREYWGDEACDYANASAEQLDLIYKAVTPSLVVHGHHHRRKSTIVRDGNHVTHFESLNKEDNNDAVVILDMDTLKISPYIVK